MEDRLELLLFTPHNSLKVRSPRMYNGKMQVGMPKPLDCAAVRSGYSVASHRTAVARTRTGSFEMTVRASGRAPPYTDWVSHRILHHGFWEIEDIDDVLRLAPDRRLGSLHGRRGLFIDLAAHIGWYTMLFARANYSVIAIEPSAHNRLALRTTLCANAEAAKRVTIVPFAITAHPTSRACELLTFTGQDGTGQLSCTPRRPCLRYTPPLATPCRRQPCECEQVRTTTLDAVLREVVPQGREAYDVVVAKFDMEGGECDALAAGQSLFDRLRVDLVQFEGFHNRTTRCMTGVARRWGYSVGEPGPVDRNTAMTRNARWL